MTSLSWFSGKSAPSRKFIAVSLSLSVWVYCAARNRRPPASAFITVGIVRHLRGRAALSADDDQVAERRRTRLTYWDRRFNILGQRANAGQLSLARTLTWAAQMQRLIRSAVLSNYVEV